MAAKKKTAKKKAKKKVAKKAATKKKVAKKKASPKKTTTKKKVAKKTTTKKKASKVSKKTATKKKSVVKKKTTTKKKAASKKKATPAKKTAAKSTTTKKTKGKMTKVTELKTKKTSKKESIVPYQEKIGEDYMGEEQSIHFRELLNSWKDDLIAEVDRTVHHMQDEASNFPDPNDRATQEEEFSLELRTRDRERKLIRKIDEALSALDNGDYGYCEVCGIEIGVKRLEARPTATLCIDCKTLDEIKERQLG
jgi:DnaK suppressor protein